MKLSERFNTPAARVIFTAAMVLASLILLLGNCRFGGLGDGDEGYQLMCVRHWETSPLGMLSYWIGWHWMSLFPGYEVLASRCLVSLLMFLAIATGCWFCWRRTGNLLLSAALMPMCALGNRIGDFYLLNWDTGTYLFDAVALAALLSFTYRPARWKAAVAGGALALMTLGRLPLAVEGLVAVWVIVASCRRAASPLRDMWMYLGIGLGTYALTAALTMTAMCGSPAAYFATLVPENFITGHGAGDISAIANRLKMLIPRQVWYLFIGFLALGGAAAVHYARRHRGAVALTVIAVSCYYCVTMMSEAMLTTDWGWALLGSFLSVFLVIIFWLPISALCRRPGGYAVHVPWLQLITAMVFIILISFGSDTFFERISTPFAIPMVIGCTWPSLTRSGRGLMKLYIAFVTLTFGVMWLANVINYVVTYTVRMDEYPHQRGLITEPGQNYLYLMSRAAIQACRDSGTDYMIFGYRHNMLITIGEDNGLPHHWFDTHLYNHPGGYMVPLEPYARRKDAVIYSGNINIQPTELAQKLAPLGYETVWHVNNCTLYVKRDKVPRVQAALDSIISSSPATTSSIRKYQTSYAY